MNTHSRVACTQFSFVTVQRSSFKSPTLVDYCNPRTLEPLRRNISFGTAWSRNLVACQVVACACRRPFLARKMCSYPYFLADTPPLAFAMTWCHPCSHRDDFEDSGEDAASAAACVIRLFGVSLGTCWCEIACWAGFPCALSRSCVSSLPLRCRMRNWCWQLSSPSRRSWVLDGPVNRECRYWEGDSTRYATFVVFCDNE